MKQALLSSGSAFLLTLSLAAAAWIPNSAVAVQNSNTDARSAAELYGKYCDSCHGKDGRAKTLKGKFKHARNFTDAEWQGNVTDERIYNSISNGKGKMPRFNKKMSEEEINSIVTYVRGFKK
jgi:mono/diheme cytochrome c family protein